MAVVKVLAYKCVWLDRPIDIHLRHVEVIYEVDESLGGRRSKITTRLLFQGLLKDACGKHDAGHISGK